MKIFVRNVEDTIIKSEVISIGEDFNTFLMQSSKMVKTSGGRIFITLPYIFEKIDNSNVYIVRDIKTPYIKDIWKDELLDGFKD